MKLRKLLALIEQGYIIRWTNDPLREGAFLSVEETRVHHLKAEAIYCAVAKGYLKRQIDGRYKVTKKGRKKL